MVWQYFWCSGGNAKKKIISRFHDFYFYPDGDILCVPKITFFSTTHWSTMLTPKCSLYCLGFKYERVKMLRWQHAAVWIFIIYVFLLIFCPSFGKLTARYKKLPVVPQPDTIYIHTCLTSAKLHDYPLGCAVNTSLLCAWVAFQHERIRVKLRRWISTAKTYICNNSLPSTGCSSVTWFQSFQFSIFCSFNDRRMRKEL